MTERSPRLPARSPACRSLMRRAGAPAEAGHAGRRERYNTNRHFGVHARTMKILTSLYHNT